MLRQDGWAACAAASGNDWQRAGRAEAAAERVSIIAAIRGEPAKTPRSYGDNVGRDPYVAGIAGREMDDRRATEDIGDNVDLGGLPAARRADGLRLRPPLPP